MFIIESTAEQDSFFPCLVCPAFSPTYPLAQYLCLEVVLPRCSPSASYTESKGASSFPCPVLGGGGGVSPEAWILSFLSEGQRAQCLARAIVCSWCAVLAADWAAQPLGTLFSKPDVWHPETSIRMLWALSILPRTILSAEDSCGPCLGQAVEDPDQYHNRLWQVVKLQSGSVGEAAALIVDTVWPVSRKRQSQLPNETHGSSDTG